MIDVKTIRYDCMSVNPLLHVYDDFRLIEDTLCVTLDLHLYDWRASVSQDRTLKPPQTLRSLQ